MEDYYTLLGVGDDATVDDIRGAYRTRKDAIDTSTDAGRADAARLNKAWNVLSDPYQRGRYDEQRSAAATNGEELESAELVSANGAGSGAKSRSAAPRTEREARRQAAAEARAARLRAQATITPPAGTRWPLPKQRVLAMVVDLMVLVVLVSGSQVIAQSVAKSEKPAVVDQVNKLNDQITSLNKQKSDADKAVSADKKANDTAKQATDQKKSDDLKNQISTVTKERDKELTKLNVYFEVSLIVAFVLGLLYLVIPSAITGRTLGKRFQHLKALREDGSPLGARGALVRYGLLVLVTFALYFVLHEIAAVVVLFGVTTWMRNGNMQGMHDRIAHTIVVTDA